VKTLLQGGGISAGGTLDIKDDYLLIFETIHGNLKFLYRDSGRYCLEIKQVSLETVNSHCVKTIGYNKVQDSAQELIGVSNSNMGTGLPLVLINCYSLNLGLHLRGNKGGTISGIGRCFLLI